MKKSIDGFICKKNISLSRAMKAIDDNGNGIIFLTEKDGKLAGCITDGDIRRFLLSGGSMDDKAINAANLSPKVARSLEEAKSIYHKRNFRLIPIVNDKGEIADLFSGDGGQTVRRGALDIPVVINAGGKGTRLEPFTKVLPKPLIPVGDIPIIEMIMKEYQSYSCNDFHIIVNYKKELIKAYFSESESNYNITWYDEEEPLGTGGGMSLLKGKIDSTFFFINCDALLTANYERILEFHRENGNAITMVCAYKNLNIPYGIVEIGVNGSISKMQEKPLVSFLTNTGIYVVEPEVINDVEDNVSIGFPDIIEMEMKRGRKVAAFPISESEWMDMGQLPELQKMREKLYGI